MRRAASGRRLAIGGTGGTGGDAGVVSLSNGGAITTRGDGADAVFAQSVGGGGGVGGGGVATANGGKLSIAVGVGGSGGAGGNGNTATVTNSGSIVTRGTDSIGISVQSVGGGGGKAGKGGATAGGTNPVSNATSLFNILAGGLNFGQTVKDLGDGVLQIGQIGQEIQATFDELNGIFSQPQADPSKKNIGNSPNINVAVSVGGYRRRCRQWRCGERNQHRIDRDIRGSIRRHLCPKRRRRRRQRRRREFDRQGS